MSIEKLKLHCFGNQWSVFYDVMKKCDLDIFYVIRNNFMELESKLNGYSVDYSDLKSALIPPDGKKHFDFLFLYDYSKCDECFLGELVFEKLFHILENDNFKKTNTSIFSGDLLFDRAGYEEIIDYINKYSVQKIKPYKSNYFVVLMSHLTENQSKYINDLFKDDRYYTCCVNITFKNDLVKVNLLLPSVGLKNKDKFIMSIPEEGEENLYSKFLPKEWKPVFVIDYLFDSFLKYNYQTNVYCGNEDFTNYSLVVDEDKYNYLTSNKSHVSKILCNVQANDIDNFKNVVQTSLSNNIFNIILNIHGIRFNTLIDVNNHRLFFSFEYISEKKKLD